MHVSVDDGGVDWPAWVQAAGAILALAIAVTLPRLDRRRARREYERAAMAAAMFAHGQIAAIWVIGQGLPPQADPRDFVDELDRAAGELGSFSLLGSPSIAAVTHLRELGRCARGAAALARKPAGDLRERSSKIVNYAHHLLVLIARELRQPEPPAPFSDLGVPPDVVAAVARRGKTRA